MILDCNTKVDNALYAALHCLIFFTATKNKKKIIFVLSKIIFKYFKLHYSYLI